MSSTFEEVLDQIIDYAVSAPPAMDWLEKMQAILRNQENKIKALDVGLAESLMEHYAASLNVQTKEMVDTRIIIVQMMTNLIFVKKGRDRFLGPDIGLGKLLGLLQDPNEEVRVQACKLFDTLVVFHESHDLVLSGKVVMNSLTDLLLNDSTRVSKAAVPALSTLCEYDPNMDMDGICVNKLVGYLQENIDAAKMSDEDDVVLQFVQSILQCIWHVTADLQQKDIAIDMGVVTTITPLLLSLQTEIKRLATGCIMSIAISEKGKIAIIETEGVVDSLCRCVLKVREFAPTRQNAIDAIRNVIENQDGLLLCGTALLQDSEIVCDIFAPAQIAKLMDQCLDVSEHTTVALEVLALTFKDEDGRKVGWNILEIVERLYILSRKGSSQRIKGNARRCLETLCADNLDAQQQLDSLPEIQESEVAQGEGEEGDSSNAAASAAVGGVSAAETVLMLLQFQNDFTKKQGKLHKMVSESMEENQMIWNTVDLTEKARRKGVQVIHCPLALEGSDEKTAQEYGVFKEMVESRAFEPKSWGAQITEELPPETEDQVLGNMSKLSAFADTGMLSMLRDRGIKNLIVCGFSTDGCVDATVRDAYEAGFEIFVMNNCCAASSSAAQANALGTVLPKFATVEAHTAMLQNIK